MASHFEDIGYRFEQPGDLLRFFDANSDLIQTYDLGTGCSLHLLSPSEDCEIHVFVDDLDDRVRLWAPFSAEMKESLLYVDRLIDSDPDILWGLLRVEDPYDRMDIPFNIELLLNDMDVSQMEGGYFYIETLAFAESVELYGPGEGISGETGLAKEALIPCGLFPPDGETKNFHESAHMIMNAVINEVEKLTNPLTGLEFYRLWTGALGFYTSVLAPADAFSREPVIGDYVHGIFYLMGRLSDEEVYEEELDSQLSEQFGIRVPASDEDMERVAGCLKKIAKGERGFFIVNYRDLLGRQTFIQACMSLDQMSFTVEYNVPGSAEIRMADGSVKKTDWRQFSKDFDSADEALDVFRRALTGACELDVSGWEDISELILSESDELAAGPESRIVS